MMEEEVVVGWEVKVVVVMREEVRVDMVVVHWPPEREEKLEFTLTSILQMRKLRPPPRQEYPASDAILEEKGGRSSPWVQSLGSVQGHQCPLEAR